MTAVIELKARLDEERNILWARELEKSGVHVVFGFVGLKTHCKVALVVRREDDGIRRYVHLATGNYNPQTARIYTDLGFFTCNPDFGDDASALFNYLTGYGELPQWRKLVVAPSRLQTFMIEKIEQEAANQQAGKAGRIIAKLNGLLEPAVVQALYRASQAGVKIDLICRGICALRPGMPGREREHPGDRRSWTASWSTAGSSTSSNGGDPQVYIGSADWMDRNLSRRVEVVFPVEQPDLKQRLIDEILAIVAGGQRQGPGAAAGRHATGGCSRRTGEPAVRSQERFLELAAEAERRLAGPTVVPTPPLGANGAAGPRSPAPAEARGVAPGTAPLVPTLCVGTQGGDAPRRGLSRPVCLTIISKAPGPVQLPGRGASEARSHAERGNESKGQRRTGRRRVSPRRPAASPEPSPPRGS